ncbi:MAG: class II aldolase/adducin family protein [Methylococcaceae bacterium]|nr:class II aldolase/adducin family protein [Methylococcaceae bacterium]
MTSQDLEGVIKYELAFEHKPFAKTGNLETLIAWRAVLHRLGLIGQDPQRYGGLGFGNISQKIEQAPATRPEKCRFTISGTQTGAAERLNESQFCLVTASCIRRNRIVAEGPVKPSSEALTHAAVYHCHPDIRFVMHVHSPEIWPATHSLEIPCIAQTIAYGTPEMAQAVQHLIVSLGNPCEGVFSMLGHEDGIVAYANSAEIAGNLLIDTLVRSLTFKRPDSRG